MTVRVLPLAHREPFSLAQTIAFLRRFPPCAGDFALEGRTLRGALMLEGHGLAFEVRERDRVELVLESTTSNEAVLERAATLARAFVGADDDLESFYDAASNDNPAFRRVVGALYGLHHVRFLTLAETAVYVVLMQRTPMTVAAKQKRALLHAFGRGVGDRIAFPSFERLLELDARDFVRVIGHAAKAIALPVVLRGVHALGESYLRTAPYAEVEAALRAIPGIGPFSAAFLLLRGLGRMDAVPLEMPAFAEPAKRIYGPSFDPTRLRRLYGAQIGYWAFYVRSFHA